MRGGDTEYCDHPVGVINVISSDEANAMATLTRLNNTPSALPPVFGKGIADPQLLRFHVVLHDNASPSHNIAHSEQLLRDMKRTFGSASCRLLRVNSGSPQPLANTPWTGLGTQQSTEGVGEGSGGVFLSSQDASEVDSMLTSFVKERLLPFIEDRIRRLAEAVHARRGIKSQFKNWLRKGTAPVPATQGGRSSTASGDYGYQTPQAQQRALGDLLMCVGDFAGAVSHYRHAVEDFRSDRAWLHAAAAGEMLALSTYFSDGQAGSQGGYISSRVDSALDDAYRNCLESPRGTPKRLLFCLRISLLTLAIYGLPHRASGASSNPKVLRQRLEMAQRLLQASGDLEGYDLSAAVLLEQAALCFALASPPYLRKYSFHLILAGYRFNKSQHVHHAIRCYKSALTVYDQGRWNHSNDHINYQLARLHTNTGAAQDAVYFFTELLRNCQQSVERQASILDAFGACITTFQKSGAAKFRPPPGASENSLSLSLPSFQDDKLGVYFDIEGNVEGNETLWKHFELCAQALLEYKKEHRPPPGTIVNASWRAKSLARRGGAAQEPVTVEVTIRNPLSCRLVLRNLHLMCGLSGDEQSGGRGGTAVPDDKGEHASEVESSGVDCILDGHQTLPVQLMATTLSGGTLNIIGATWEVECGQHRVHGYHMFETRGKRLNDTRDQRSSVVYGTPPNMAISMLPPLARLKVTFSDIPSALMQGQAKRVEVTLANKGGMPLERLCLFVTHPGMFMVEMGGDAAATQSTGRSSDSGLPHVHYNRGNVRVCTSTDKDVVARLPLPQEGLVPGQEMKFVLWLRPHMQGEHKVALMFHYESHTHSVDDKGAGESHVRVVRLLWPIRVARSLLVTGTVFPSAGLPNRYVVALEVQNLSQDRSIGITGVDLVSDKWRIDEQAKMGGLLTRGSDVAPTETRIVAVAVAPSTDTKLHTPIHHAYPYLPYVESNKRDSSAHVVVLWKAAGTGTVVGQVNVGPLELVQERPPPMPSARMSRAGSMASLMSIGSAHPPRPPKVLVKPCSPLKCTWLIQEDTVAHDFETGACVVGLTLCLTNCSSSVALSIEFSAADTWDEDSAVAPPWQWLGPKRRHIAPLEPDGKAVIHARGQFADAGIYDLNQFRASVSFAETPDRPHVSAPCFESSTHKLLTVVHKP